MSSDTNFTFYYEIFYSDEYSKLVKVNMGMYVINASSLPQSFTVESGSDNIFEGRAALIFVLYLKRRDLTVWFLRDRLSYDLWILSTSLRQSLVSWPAESTFVAREGLCGIPYFPCNSFNKCKYIGTCIIQFCFSY